MSRMNQTIFIGTEDPEYYTELFYVAGILDGRRHAQRLQTLLDAVADISLCQRENGSATMACLKDDKGTLETRLYIAFNHDRDGVARRCPQHLQDIFNMLRQVPYKPPTLDGSPKVIANELENNFIEICRVIHNYSFDIFAYRVAKRKHKFSDIRRYIEQDQTYFTPQERSTLAAFLRHVAGIIKMVDNAQTTKQLPTIHIQILHTMYLYWTEHGLLPKDSESPADTLLDKADAWLAEQYSIGFPLRRWALKIMSSLISANRLFILTQSRRLHKLIQGKFSVQVLTSATPPPYCCNLSSETIQVALDAALAGTSYIHDDWDEERESFIEWLVQKLKVSDKDKVVRSKPTVHAELAMIIAMAKGEIENVLPYIGASKLSCIMCSHYICAFNEVAPEQKIAIKGSHGKAYPGWFWPSRPVPGHDVPGHDEVLRKAFLGRMRQQLVSDFEQHAETRRLSDSSVGSGCPEMHLGGTEDELDVWLSAEFGL